MHRAAVVCAHDVMHSWTWNLQQFGTGTTDGLLWASVESSMYAFNIIIIRCCGLSTMFQNTTSPQIASSLRTDLFRSVVPCQTLYEIVVAQRKGTVFHESNGFHYSGGYKEGDTLGLLIYLPNESNSANVLPPTYKDKPLVKFRSHLYYEDKDDIPAALKQLSTLSESKIIFFKNGIEQGVAFKDIYGGVYYPSLSLYKSITVSVNFGPNFMYPPKNYNYRAMDERCNETMVEQTLADVTYLVENKGKLRLDLI